MAGALSPEEVAHVAHLARLELTGDEVDHFAVQLSAVLEHVESLRRLDIATVPPTSHTLELVNVLREDVVRPGLDREEVLAGAPSAEAGRFRVPPILGEAP